MRNIRMIAIFAMVVSCVNIYGAQENDCSEGLNGRADSPRTRLRAVFDANLNASSQSKAIVEVARDALRNVMVEEGSGFESNNPLLHSLVTALCTNISENTQSLDDATLLSQRLKFLTESSNIMTEYQKTTVVAAVKDRMAEIASCSKAATSNQSVTLKQQLSASQNEGRPKTGAEKRAEKRAAAAAAATITSNK